MLGVDNQSYLVFLLGFQDSWDLNKIVYLLASIYLNWVNSLLGLRLLAK
jgi:hypothetical protein